MGYRGSGTSQAAFLYSGGNVTSLGFLPGGTQSQANSVNNSGQIVGWSTNASGHREAFLYSGGVVTGLGTLPGYTDSEAEAISNQGQVVGSATDSSGNSQAFLYSDGVMRGLGFLPGDEASEARAINNGGQVAGTSGSTSYNQFLGRAAFIYSGGQMCDLNSLAIIPLQFFHQGYVELTYLAGINDSGQIASVNLGRIDLLTPMQGRSVPVTPCRVADTRWSAGPFGGPAIETQSVRSFAIPQSDCGIPTTAVAYSLNVTAVPHGRLGFLTLWPTGLAQPFVSTLNSEDGSVVANAAIVAAGQNGAVSVYTYAIGATDVILDINGYFDPSNGDSFCPVPPCRVADTRIAAGRLGGPSLTAGQIREFPLPSSDCGLPSTAAAYSLNVTAVPPGYLGFLTIWAAGQPLPNASTLNSWNGTVVANAAIVPAGTNGATSVYVTNPSDMVLDTTGYFGPSGGVGGLSFHLVLPCRVADTRGEEGPFGGPEMEAGSTRTFDVPTSACGIPSSAAAYSLNVTAVPDTVLSYLTAWAAGAPQPLVSTLNSMDGAVVANAAIVPAGAHGGVSVFVTHRTQVVLDINGYFAP